MKKIFAILLLILLLAALCGCDSQDAGGNLGDIFGGSAAKSQIGDGRKEDSVLILDITINPKLELYINAQGRITTVRCMNKDAEAVMAAADIINLHYKEGIMAILAQSHAQGFLEKGGRVSLAPTVQNGLDWSEELSMDLTEPILSFSRMQDLSLTSSVTTPTVQDTEGGFVAFPETPENPESTVTYSNGQEYEDGSKVERIYNATGALVQELWIYPNGDRSTCFYEGGQIVRQKDVHADGSSAEIIYENGRWASVNRIDTDGSESTTVYTYHPNGQTAKVVNENSDGSCSESLYDENGICTEDAYIGADGTGYRNKWNPDGTLISSLPIGEGAEQTITYHENGQVATITVKEGACSWVSTYDTAGNMIHQQETREDGVVTETTYTYFTNGNVASQVTDASTGYHNEITYYENGEMATSKNKSEDGLYFENTYNEDGTMASQISDMGNGIVSEYRYTYHANGQKASEVMDNSDGYHMERTFYENGKMATDNWTSPDLGFGISRYNSAGVEIYHEEKNPYGYSKMTCRDDGTREYSLGESDGYREEVYFHTNGNKHTSETWFSDGAYQKETCDETGKVLSVEDISADNWHTVRTYNSDGSSVQLTTRSDGSTLKVTYDAAGNVLSTEDSNKNWQSAQ